MGYISREGSIRRVEPEEIMGISYSTNMEESRNRKEWEARGYRNKELLPSLSKTTTYIHSLSLADGQQ